MGASPPLVLTTLEGGAALSAFRSAALLRRLREVAPEIADVTARYVHWVASDDALDPATLDTLTRLLEYGEPYAAPAPHRGRRRWPGRRAPDPPR